MQKKRMEIEDAPDARSGGEPNSAAVGVGLGLLVVALLAGPPLAANAQSTSTSNQSSSSHVEVGKDGSSSNISINNGVVTVDGEAVPPDARAFTSHRGNHYRIDRQGGSVEVHQQ
jgi:hypothetical protein